MLHFLSAYQHLINQGLVQKYQTVWHPIPIIKQLKLNFYLVDSLEHNIPFATVMSLLLMANFPSVSES